MPVAFTYINNIEIERKGQKHEIELNITPGESEFTTYYLCMPE